MESRSNIELLLSMVHRHNLYHVRTSCYKDVEKVLRWLDVPSSEAYDPLTTDAGAFLRRCVSLSGRTGVHVMDITDKLDSSNKSGKLVVCEIDNGGGRTKYFVQFVIIQFSPYSLHTGELNSVLSAPLPHLPNFDSYKPQFIKHVPQEKHPVIEGFLPTVYKTTKVCQPSVVADGFNRKYTRPPPAGESDASEPWFMYTVKRDRKPTDDVDIIARMQSRVSVLGRGGFGVIVSLNQTMAAKVPLCSEMTNWSVSHVDKEFNCYAHVAQVEEAMVGVSLKHPNILRTFGAFWCADAQDKLSGKAVIVMERAIFTLHEYTKRLADKANAVVPLVELDTLRGLEYMKKRALQHRDLTHRNILVCYEKNRRPAPISFKISDFGTSSNFLSPDQMRGNRTNMAPEMLWCLTSCTASDIFSWYCVMWEMYAGKPVIAYKTETSPCCRATYAANLAKLLGVYTPEDSSSFCHEYMRKMNAETLVKCYKGVRPSAEEIHNSLKAMANETVDRRFIAIGILCITLHPQERWGPSQLLALDRYKALSKDVSPAEAASAVLPAAVRLGDCVTTDAIVAEDCSSVDKNNVSLVDTGNKTFYGIDVLRLAPGKIQPYDWYRKKVSGFMPTRRTSAAPAKTKRPSPHTPGPAPRSLGKHCKRLEPESALCRDANYASSSLDDGQVAEQLKNFSICGQSKLGAAPDDLQAVFRCRQITGELDTVVLIVTSNSERLEDYYTVLIRLATDVTHRVPQVLTGPRSPAGLTLRGHNMFVFQYAKLYDEHTAVCHWTPKDDPTNRYVFVMQVLLTLEAAAQACVLPVYMADWSHVVMTRHGGAVVDVISYLSKNIRRLRSPMFGSYCYELRNMINELFKIHLPDIELLSPPLAGTSQSALSVLRTAIGRVSKLSDVSNQRLNGSDMHDLSTSHFTFKNYLADVIHWLSMPDGTTTPTVHRSTSALLAFGEPKAVRGNQTESCLSEPNMDPVLRNIIIRLKRNIFNTAKVQAVSANYTQGLVTIAVNPADLAKIPPLWRAKFTEEPCDSLVTHDAKSLDFSKWAPVIKITKHNRAGPVPSLAMTYYKATVIFVLLQTNSRTLTVQDIFNGLHLTSFADY